MDLFISEFLMPLLLYTTIGVILLFFLEVFRRTRQVSGLTPVLVVDDTGQILADFQNYLNKYQPDCYDITTAADVEQARQILDGFQPQYAIVDLRLDKPSLLHSENDDKKGIDSELKGLQLIKFILENKLPTRIIVLSGFTHDDVKDKIASTFADFPNKDKILQDIEQNYVYKGKGNYILAVLDKLKK